MLTFWLQTNGYGTGIMKTMKTFAFFRLGFFLFVMGFCFEDKLAIFTSGFPFLLHGFWFKYEEVYYVLCLTLGKVLFCLTGQNCCEFYSAMDKAVR